MKSIALFLKMIQFKHTVFSLPFVLAGAWMAANGTPATTTLFLIICAAVFARTAGMCINRVADLKFDRLNPRTAQRPLVTGEIPIYLPKVIAILCFLLFWFVAFLLNDLSFYLAPIAIVMIFFYSFLKRWTVLCHFGIGLVIAFAPLGGWIGVRNSIEIEAMWLSIAVLFWVAGFDILYSMQDRDFDIEAKLHSIPAHFGQNCAMNISAICHALTLLCLYILGTHYPFHPIYMFGLLFAAFILLMEHVLIRVNFNKFVNFSFFTLNGVLSLIFMLVVCASV